MKIEISNMLIMIGCNKQEFEEIMKNASGKITMSSSSYYGDYEIYDNAGILAIFDYKGIVKYKRLKNKDSKFKNRKE